MNRYSPKSKKRATGRRFFWGFVFIVLAVATIWVITENTKDFSWKKLLSYLKSANPFWMIGAFCCMLGFVVFEGVALRRLEIFFGHRRSLLQNTVYSAGDVYFSAITPSATGGQPASAMLMIRDGIPGATTAMILLVNVMIYTVSLVLIGLFCLIFFPSIFLAFSIPSRVLILVGLSLQFIFVGVLMLLIVKEKIVIGIADWCMRLLQKLHLMRNIETHRENLARTAAEYRACADALKGHTGVVVRVLLCNLGQRLCNICVTVCVCFAVGVDLSSFVRLFVTQCYVVLGSNSVPIPGAVGVADGLFLDGFSSVLEDTACIELLSRGISFYLCLILCAGLFFASMILHSVKQRRNALRDDQ